MQYYNPLTDKVSSVRAQNDPWSISIGDEPNTATTNTSFDGDFQFVWDSVSINALKTCPRYYEWSIKKGYQLDPQPSTLSFGIYFHRAVEYWHKLLAHGMDKENALLRIVRLAGLLGEQIVPGRSERTKETLLRAVVWYLDQFKDDMAETTKRPNGEPAVEYSFMIPLIKIKGQQTFLAGHFDRIVMFMDKLFICDYKTTKMQLNTKFFAQFKPNTQVQGYLAAAHIIGGTSSVLPTKPAGLIIDGIQLGVNYARFHRSVINYSKMEIDSYLADLEHWITWAHTLADAKHWPANETSCSNYGGCVFRSICSETPAKHERMLKNNFHVKIWDPRIAR